MSERQEVVGLVSCVKSKQTKPAAAQDMYTSTLFRGMRCYAEAMSDRWFILSAKHGLLEPGRMIESYDLSLKNLSRAERAAWASHVVRAIEGAVSPGARLLVLAGAAYFTGLETQLRRQYILDVPLRGLGLGKRLRWLRQANSAWHVPA
jgi:hypothetical protein